MVNVCAIFYCSNHADREKEKSFFRVPKIIQHRSQEDKDLSTRRGNAWIAAIKRKDPTDEKINSQFHVCSDYFVTGSYPKI